MQAFVVWFDKPALFGLCIHNDIFDTVSSEKLNVPAWLGLVLNKDVEEVKDNACNIIHTQTSECSLCGLITYSRQLGYVKEKERNSSIFVSRNLL